MLWCCNEWCVVIIISIIDPLLHADASNLINFFLSTVCRFLSHWQLLKYNDHSITEWTWERMRYQDKQVLILIMVQIDSRRGNATTAQRKDSFLNDVNLLIPFYCCEPRDRARLNWTFDTITKRSQLKLFHLFFFFTFLLMSSLGKSEKVSSTWISPFVVCSNLSHQNSKKINLIGVTTKTNRLCWCKVLNYLNIHSFILQIAKNLDRR